MADRRLHWATVCLVLQICLSENQDLDTYIDSLHLKHAGYQDFDLSSVYETRNKQRVDSTVLDTRELAGDHVELSLPAFGEVFRLRTTPTTTVLHPLATVFVTRGDTQHAWTGSHPNCFLSGEVTSHAGTVTLSYCDGLHGVMTTPTHVYRIDPLPGHLSPSDFSVGDIKDVLISRKSNTQQSGVFDRGHAVVIYQVDLENADDYFVDAQHVQSTLRHKRSVPSHDVTIESAVFADAPFTALMGTNNTAKRLELMLLKYNMVQMEWARSAMLGGYNVKIQIKYLNFFETNPSWYNVSGDNYSGLLHTLCTGTRHLPHDHVLMHTGHHGTSVLGRSFQSHICNHNYRCGFESSRDVIAYIATTHEMGHGMGMYHDVDRGCSGNDTGLMGGYGAGWSSCSRRDMDHFLNSGHASCLWREDVPLRNVTAPLQAIHFNEALIGQIYSPDEVCELLHGKGVYFRKYPKLNVCQLFSCADLTPGPLYGRMFRHSYDITGQYCGDRKICFKNSCSTWEHARQYNLTIRAGGWSEWSAWVPCARTCGTGLTYRQRTCTNPKPKNHAPCEGDHYQASTCNTMPCNNDSEDKRTLIKQRASETCSRLITNGHLNASLHRPTGDRFNKEALLGQCEVQCIPVSGFTPHSFFRYGLMPDGAHCDVTGLDNWDKQAWPRRPGTHGRCLQGYCLKFDCAGELMGTKVFDGCGVCGGNNSTCRSYTGQYTDTLNKGVRDTVVALPTGAYNIQFWVSYSHTHQTFIELWNKDSLPVLASYVSSSWIWDDRANPIEFDGTYWYFLFSGQYLYTEGPITSPAIIKAFQHSHTATAGIHYAYSVPLSVARCSGTCDRGGVWNQTLCSCSCPQHVYGPTCTSTCNKYCMNGAHLDNAACKCRCNARQHGHHCACKPLYSGKECRECASSVDCSDHGNLNTNSCLCDCDAGFTGQNCSTSAPQISGPIVG